MVSTTLFLALALAQAPALPVPVRSFYRATQENERRVSLRVSDASLKDVLSKLPKVDYVVDADAFKGRRITLSLTDVTTTEALNAIASALDAHWESVGGVRVLKKGAGLGFNGTGFRTFTVPSEEFQFFGDGKTQFRTMPRIEMKELFKDGKGFQGLSLEQEMDIQEALEEAQKHALEQPNLDEKTRKAIEEAFKSQKESFRALQEANGLRGGAYEKARADIEARRKAIEQSRRSADSVGRNEVEVDDLLKSLTPAQKDLAKSQGYLKLSDLTPEQRKLTGHTGDGTFDLTITRDGQTLKIKNG